MNYIVVCRMPIVSNIIVSVSADRIEYMHHVMSRFNHNCVSLIEGADTRHRSIYNAVKAIPCGVLKRFVKTEIDITITRYL